MSILGGWRRAFVVLVLAGTLVGGACGGGSKSDKSLNVLFDYLVATSNNDTAKIEELVEPDSPLAAYLPMLSLYSEALRQYGKSIETPVYTIENKSVIGCFKDGECSTSTNPVVNKSGRLEDYTDTAGRTMDQKLLIAQPQQQSVYGGTVTAYPYFASSGSLTVVVKFVAGPSGYSLPLSPQVFFTGGDRVQMAPTSAVRPDIYNLAPGNSQTRAWSFKGAVPSGKFEVEVRDGGPRTDITLVPFEILATTVPTTETPTTLAVVETPSTLPPTPTTRPAAAPQALPPPPPTAPVATVDPAVALRAACTSSRDRYIANEVGRMMNIVRADAPQETNANPLTWLVVFRYDIGEGPQSAAKTIVCQPNGTIQAS